ncbi:MAG: DUF4249 family protein [Bacteroidales bacterium]|nr:DUF4249 family protein [Bacteroidales bacterium]
MKKTIYILAALLAVSSCIYPFSPDVMGTGEGLVVEGDVLIGDISVFSLSSVSPLNGDATSRPNGTVWVEDEFGNKYKSYSEKNKKVYVDLTDAPADRMYRIHVLLSNPGEKWDPEYVSGWRYPQPEPVISSIDLEPTESELNLTLSLQSPEGSSGCYRWDYELDWEYNADYQASFLYDPDYDRLIDLSMTGQPNPYYICYSHSYSTESGLAIAKTLQGQGLYGHEFHRVSRWSPIASRRMAALVKARIISEDCYEYLNTLQETSDYTGSLFTTIPSGMQGNIRSVSDSTHMAVGFIEVSHVAEKRRFFDVAPYYYRKTPAETPAVLEYDKAHPDMKSWYNIGYRPVDDLGEGGAVRWIKSRCVDCRELGGVTTPPEYWVK